MILTPEIIAAKEREIDVRRQQLQLRSQRVDNALAGAVPNFPPKFLCIEPIVYHNIAAEVPLERQPLAKVNFAVYITLCVMILLNIIAALIGFATPSTGDTKIWGTHFGVSFLFLLGIPGAFVSWYFVIYTAISKGNSGKYSLAKFGICLGFLFDVYIAIGIFGFGGCGWLYVVAAQSEKSNVATTIVSVINSCLWCAHACTFVYLWSKLRIYCLVDEAKELGFDLVPIGNR